MVSAVFLVVLIRLVSMRRGKVMGGRDVIKVCPTGWQVELVGD